MAQKISADFAIVGATVITMNKSREVIPNGAVAVKGDRIVWVGSADDYDHSVTAEKKINAVSDVLCPGFINTHVHTTGDPLTRHYMPDHIGGPDALVEWVLPRYFAHTPADEQLSAKLCAVELLKSGTTTFIEAGTIRHLDEAVDGFRQTGIRGRVGAWVEGRAFDPEANPKELIDNAIRIMEDEVRRYPATPDSLIGAWPILVGHNTNPAEVWQAAKKIADENNISVAAHMSPYQSDPDWYQENTGMRPANYLGHLGVLDKNLLLTHMTHMDKGELDLLVDTQTNIAFCPFASLKGAFGVSAVSMYTDFLKAGGNITFATDGYDTEILPATRIGAALFKDLEQNTSMITALRALEKITCGAAAAIGMADELGTLERGKKADMLCFNTNNFQWRPFLDPVAQLVWSADSRSLQDVWVDGTRLVSGGKSTLINEEKLLSDAQTAAEDIIKRANLPL